jgi:hypothetical protein
MFNTKKMFRFEKCSKLKKSNLKIVPIWKLFRFKFFQIQYFVRIQNLLNYEICSYLKYVWILNCPNLKYVQNFKNDKKKFSAFRKIEKWIENRKDKTERKPETPKKPKKRTKTDNKIRKKESYDVNAPRPKHATHACGVLYVPQRAGCRKSAGATN